MKYQTEIEIKIPRDQLVALYADRENYRHWQPSLVKIEQIKGDGFETGSQARLTVKMGKREMEMVETISRNELPERIDQVYETPGVYNKNENVFIAVDASKTRWVQENLFEFEKFPLKLMATFTPGMFKKQSQKYMADFKTYAEGQ